MLIAKREIKESRTQNRIGPFLRRVIEWRQGGMIVARRSDLEIHLPFDIEIAILAWTTKDEPLWRMIRSDWDIRYRGHWFVGATNAQIGRFQLSVDRLP